MTIRHIPYGLLTSHLALVTIVSDRIYDAGSLGTPTGKDVPAKPFIVTNYGVETVGPAEDARVFDRTLDVWFYGNPGDFTVIEKGITEIRRALHDKTGWFVDPDTEVKTWLNSCRYQGSSADLYDDVYRANAKYGSFRLIGNTP